MVVEDDQELGELFDELLSDHGYSVRTARNGLAAIELLGTWRPDLILLDMMMPVVDGYAFRQAQLAHPEWRAIPVVVVSAASEFLGEADALGAKAILGKPLDFDELLRVVDTWSGPGG
jgi:two-component system chemotaxis response regulator CheY